MLAPVVRRVIVPRVMAIIVWGSPCPGRLCAGDLRVPVLMRGGVVTSMIVVV